MSEESRPCTAQEALYAAHWIKHGNKAEAYRAAYSCKKSSPKTVANNAGKLHDRPSVQVEIKRLQDEQKEKFDFDVESIKQVLCKVALRGLQDKIDRFGNVIPIDLKAAVSAMAEMNRMNGNHAPVKSQLTGPNDGPIEVKSLNDFYADVAANNAANQQAQP